MDNASVTRKLEVDKEANDLVKEALESRSTVTFNGDDVKISMNAEDKERNEYAADRKKAIHNALNEVNAELGIKDDKKGITKDSKNTTLAKKDSTTISKDNKKTDQQ